MKAELDILIPTYHRHNALAVTLASLINQEYGESFRLVISDQTEGEEIIENRSVATALRVLQYHGNAVQVMKHISQRGMAEQRNFLLQQAEAPYVLFLDDDLLLEKEVVSNLVTVIKQEKCGYAGCAVIGLSFIDDIRPHEQEIEFWNGPVEPEEIHPGSAKWGRYKLHNAANLAHVQDKLGLRIGAPRCYKVAWVGGCVLYDRLKLIDVGGFSFWEELPPKHSGEDVLAQLRVMRKYGGCGLIPSGVYHQEYPTQIPERIVDAPKVLTI